MHIYILLQLLDISWLITQDYNSRRSQAFSGVCLSLILSVCPHDNSKTNECKVFKFGEWNDLGISYKWYDLKVQKSRYMILGLKGHSVTKC